MFQRMIDEFKDSTGTALRLTSLAAIAALALLITMSFLCAAAFVFIFQKYGLIEACMTAAGIFFVITLIAAASYMVRRRSVKVRAKGAAKSAGHAALADPTLVAAGIEIVRAVGIKRLIPILLVGGLALGFLASRRDDDEQPKE
jgi:hypothetical protein